MHPSSFTFAWRNIRKYPAFSLINLGGLAIGIAASFVLLVYSQREMSCDRQFRDHDRIARIGTDFFNMGGFAPSQPFLREFLRASCKDVQYATALMSGDLMSVRTQQQDRAYTAIRAYYIDSVFFKVFSYPVASGAVPQAGLAPGQTILMEDEARKFFGSQDPIGRTIYVAKENQPYQIVAVLKSSFQKSHLDPRLFLPLPATAIGKFDGNWSSASLYNYVKLTPQGSMAGLQRWLDRLREKVIYPTSGAIMSFAQWQASPKNVKFTIQPLADIYFHSNLNFELSPGGNLTQVKLLGAIGLFLILLAIINYVNLVTARSSVRSREIGIKKTFGASRVRLGRQMLLESLFFSLLAMGLAVVLIRGILFAYKWATGIPLTGPMSLTPMHYLWLLVFSLVVGMLAGVYPAIYLTAFKPILSIRSLAMQSGKGNGRVRNVLVIFQFMVAAGLVFSSFVIYAQWQFMQNKDKGLSTQGVLTINNLYTMGKRTAAFRQVVEQQAQVVSTSLCERAPASNDIVMYTYKTPAMSRPMTIPSFPVDARYIQTLGLHLTSCRNFDKDLVSDTNSLILNESAVAALGLFNPVGSTINGSERVIGVVKDFNYASFRQKIGPVVLRYSQTGCMLAVKISGGHVNAFLDQLNAKAKEFTGGEPLEINWLDDNFAKLAEKEKLLGEAITFFTALAILLATLGLVGLTLFTIERRTREIGIRKVLGANVDQILRLVSRDFIRLAVIAALVAFPISWWLMNRWLEDFAYRIHVGVGTFFLAGAVIVMIAWSVVSLLTIRAAMANPIHSLRTE
ncbi:MAG: ABC transporter permease [Bacteroidota bacterium]|nr:ABC transporter permease [Bacteroidota bacterium]